MKVLVACEESQRVCSAFRQLGHEAYSCDIINCSGGHPEWHIKGDVLPLLNPQSYDPLEPKYYPHIQYCMIKNYDGEYVKTIGFKTMDGELHSLYRWDLIIAHPPCTYLTVTGNRWFNVKRYGEKAIERMKLREEAKDFFMAFINADCDHVAVENPIGVMSTSYRKPDQIVQPYWFGDPFEKRTCLWLKGLPILKKDMEVTPEERTVYKSGNSLPTWFAAAASLPAEGRSRVRSQTFPGFARAMAEQWSEYLSK